MADLEERILKKNIPGRYSQWGDEYKEERRHETYDNYENGNDNEGDDEEEEAQTTDPIDTIREWEKNEIPKPIQLSALSASYQKETGNSCNTGPKGVLRDYKIEKQRQEYNKAVEKEIQDSIVHRIAYGATLQNGEVSMSHAALEEEKKIKKQLEKLNYQLDSSSDESDDFLNEYRQKRMLQLKQASNFPVFGEILEVDLLDYTSIVDDSDPRAMVIIHMYEPSAPLCNKLNMHLEQAARQMTYARFLRMRPKEGFDTIALPVIVIYRNGELIHNWIRVVPDYVPYSYDYTDLQELLESRGGVISPYSNEYVAAQNSTLQTDRGQKNSYQRNQIIKDVTVYDSDDAELDEFCSDFVSM